MGKIKIGIRMKVNPEQSRKVQEICFENDIEWASGTCLKHLDKPFIYINDSHLLGYREIWQEELFYMDKIKEVSAEFFIRTKGTCVESEVISTEDNNKGEQMKELKLECLVNGYEGTYFEVGQVWETWNGEKIILKDFINDKNYPLLFDIGNGDLEEFTLNGTFYEEIGHRLDLIKLIPTETPTEATPSKEPQPKTLSEYLKENNAYESFVENCVEKFLNDINIYNEINRESKKGSIIGFGNAFNWTNTKQGHKYWSDLDYYKPKNIEYDMNEIIFAEVDKRIAEQKATTKYMVFVEGRSNPKKIHDSYDSAEKEAKILSDKEIGCNVMVLSVVKTFKSKVIVEEIE